MKSSITSKILHRTALALFGCMFAVAFSALNPAQAQTDMKQRVERYLYVNYNANKAAMQENERMISRLEEKLDQYLDKLTAENIGVVKTHEKEVNLYLAQIEKISDQQALKKFVEAEHKKFKAKHQALMQGDINVAEDALVCRKLIILRLADHEFMQVRQEKLMALLKDETSRIDFIQSIMAAGKVKDNHDAQSFTAAVDGEVDRMKR